MADETIAVLEQVVGGPAHLVGYSDGGIVALLVAIRRPDLVRRLVVIGTNFHHDGLHDLDFDPESPVAAMIADDFGTKSPDGVEHFTVVLDKTITMFATEPTMRASDLASIATPTLVMAGDDDLVKLTHTCGLYEALPESQLAIVPGTSHFLVLEKPELATQMILDFLHSPSPPPTLTPHRRAEQPPLETSTA
jgi:pimeloyl-ACP methyl ester carboxylesterase